MQIQCLCRIKDQWWQKTWLLARVLPRGRIDINVEGRPIQQVSHSFYLGAVISGDGTIDKELSPRIHKASGAFYQLISIWNCRNIRTPTKVRIKKAVILTILLYGNKVWKSTQTQMKRFEDFHQRLLRRILIT